jgi:hypothetical protein
MVFYFPLPTRWERLKMWIKVYILRQPRPESLVVTEETDGIHISLK